MSHGVIIIICIVCCHHVRVTGIRRYARSSTVTIGKTTLFYYYYCYLSAIQSNSMTTVYSHGRGSLNVRKNFQKTRLFRLLLFPSSQTCIIRYSFVWSLSRHWSTFVYRVVSEWRSNHLLLNSLKKIIIFTYKTTVKLRNRNIQKQFVYVRTET